MPRAKSRVRLRPPFFVPPHEASRIARPTETGIFSSLVAERCACAGTGRAQFERRFPPQPKRWNAPYSELVAPVRRFGRGPVPGADRPPGALVADPESRAAVKLELPRAAEGGGRPPDVAGAGTGGSPS